MGELVNDQPPSKKPNLDEIYNQLLRGFGHELVNDSNAEELAARARADGHQLLAPELQEWKRVC